MVQPVPPLGTSNIGVDASGNAWRNTPKGLVEIGGALNPSLPPGVPGELLIDGEGNLIADAAGYGVLAALMLPPGQWRVFGQARVLFATNITINLGLHLNAAEAFPQALASGTVTIPGGSDLMARTNAISVAGGQLLFLKASSSGVGFNTPGTFLFICQRES